jgi:DNA-binding transcriptional MerR regulator/methylmalonyl-CoA mutase cobalamin-binding subunit
MTEKQMYSIGTTSRLSGVPVETIRIWERRYGVPMPQRTKGGHRKYDDEQVKLLQAMKALVDSGMRVGTLTDRPVQEILQAADRLQSDQAVVRAVKDEVAYEVDQSALHQLVQDAIDAGRERDVVRLGTILDRPLRNGHAADVLLGLYLPLLRRVGDLWEAGKLEVATEHFIEKQVTARMHSILKDLPAGVGPSAVLACLPEERHEGGLLAAAILLSQQGFKVTYYGGDLPVAELLSALVENAPKLLVLSAVVGPSEEHIRQLKVAMDAPELRDTRVVVGGHAAASVASERITTIPSLEVLSDIARELR